MAPAATDQVDLYLRISLDKSGQELGVDRQERECRALCTKQGWTVRNVYRDNSVSATSKRKRPAFEELVKARPSRIVMWSVDRLVRMGPDLERLIELDVPIHSVMAGPMDLATASGRLNARLLTSVATFEGEIKSERQKAQQFQRRSKGGQWWSQRPFGYNWEPGCSEITLHEEEASLIRQGYERLSRGGTYVSICELWTAAGSLTAKGKSWTPVTVRQLLQSRRNAGQVVHEGQVIAQGSWPAIIEPERLDAILRMAGNPAMVGRTTGKRRAVLSGLVTCATCGLPLQQRTRGSKARGVQKIYRPKCGHVSAPVEWLDDYVAWCVSNALHSPYVKKKAKADRGVELAKKKIEKLQEKLEEVNRQYLDDAISGAQLATLSQGIRAQMDPLQWALDASETFDPVRDAGGFVELIQAWEGGQMDLLTRRGVISSLFPKIEVLPRKPGRRMTPDAVAVYDVAGDVFEMDVVKLTWGNGS